MNLVILNYSMNSENLVFSHQRGIAERLLDYFEEVIVITAETYKDTRTSKLKIISTNWSQGNKVKSLFRFYKTVLPILWKQRRSVFFSHMTDVQAFLVAPFLKLFRSKHYLWYAHKSLSPFLILAFPLLNGVITSTSGSCPLSGRKVHPIGQSINPAPFKIINTMPEIPPKRWFYIGRIDPSKKIEEIVIALNNHRERNLEISLSIYGSPSSKKNEWYLREVLNVIERLKAETWVTVHGPIANEKFAEIASYNDAFIHAFQGSLDKTLVESILAKRLIVSTNSEYLAEFKGISNSKDHEYSLASQLNYIFDAEAETLTHEIIKNYRHAIEKHSLERWLLRLMKVLTQ